MSENTNNRLIDIPKYDDNRYMYTYCFKRTIIVCMSKWLYF